MWLFTPYYDCIAPELRSWVYRFQTPHTSIWLFRWLNVGFGQLPTLPRFAVKTDTYYVTSEDAHTNTVYVYRPRKSVESRGVVFWIHGGGDVGMTAKFYHMIISPLAVDLGITVVSCEYRLGPRHAYPAALNDVHSVYMWLLDGAEGHIDVDPAQIVVAGDSFGGLLAASLCQRLADEKPRFQPVLQLLTYPMLDDRTTWKSDPSNVSRGHIMWTEPSNRNSWKEYLRKGSGPYAVPARREDLSGLPPSWLGIGDLDILYLETVDYGERMQSAGVQVHIEKVPGAFHGFDVFRNKLSNEFNAKKIEAIRSALNIPAPTASTASTPLWDTMSRAASTVVSTSKAGSIRETAKKAASMALLANQPSYSSPETATSSTVASATFSETHTVTSQKIAESTLEVASVSPTVDSKSLQPSLDVRTTSP